MAEQKPQNPTREKILAAAREMFHRQGFNEVGINALCEHAGVVKGSFYHFFPSKQALLEAVIGRNLELAMEEYEAQAGQSTDGRSKVLAQLAAVIASATGQKADGGRILGCNIGTLASELGGRNEPARVASAGAFRQWRKLLESLVQGGIEDGSIAQTVDPAATAISLLAVIQGMSTLGRCFNDPAMLTEIAQTTAKRLLPVRG